MKATFKWMGLATAAAILVLTGCNKKEPNVWDNQNTSAREGSSLWGNSDEISQSEDLETTEDFIPLSEEDLQTAFNDGAIPQPKETPGEKGSALPGIDGFSEPSSKLAAIFRTLYFNTDDHILRGPESLAALDKVASFLKENPDMYIFITGHADERGPEAYNLSLGTRRANYIRSMLVQKGVSAERLHTVSYGKERPAVIGHGPDVWKKNRRAEFKIYNKS